MQRSAVQRSAVQRSAVQRSAVRRSNSRRAETGSDSTDCIHNQHTQVLTVECSRLQQCRVADGWADVRSRPIGRVPTASTRDSPVGAPLSSPPPCGTCGGGPRVATKLFVHCECCSNAVASGSRRLPSIITAAMQCDAANRCYWGVVVTAHRNVPKVFHSKRRGRVNDSDAKADAARTGPFTSRSVASPSTDAANSNCDLHRDRWPCGGEVRCQAVRCRGSLCHACIRYSALPHG